MFVSISNLSFKYRAHEKEVISNFSLEVAKGEIIAILGASGSGKSTLLRLIAGLEVPLSGSIMIDGRCVSDTHVFVEPEKRGVGMVFQDYALFPHMTVTENIIFGIKKLPSRERQQRLQQLLELVNLQEYGNKYPYELSGGQQQRVAIARALAPKPFLLLFDEPFSNLDAHLQTSIRQELKSIIKETGITSIFVTHDEEDAQVLADRILRLSEE